jgi:4-hydroxy-4-methyl-2-oxoglutarate aldolase
MNTNHRKEFKTLASGNICDAMELLGLRRSVIHGFTFLAPPGIVLVGPAFTVRQIPKHGSASRSNKLVRHVEVSDHLAQPGDVIVIDVGGIREVCSWGEIHSLKCQKRGVAGLIIDGCVRDVEAIRKIGFPIFCLGFSPVKSLWDLETLSFNEPVMIGGIQIRPSDIVFGDETGIVVIPAEREQDVLSKANEIRKEEVNILSKLLGQDAG